MPKNRKRMTLDDLSYPQEVSLEDVLVSFYTLMRDKKNTFKALRDILNDTNSSEHHQFARESVSEASLIMEKMLTKIESYLKQKNLLK